MGLVKSVMPSCRLACVPMDFGFDRSMVRISSLMKSSSDNAHPFDVLIAQAGSVANTLRKKKTVVNSPWSQGFRGPLSSRSVETHNVIRGNKARMREEKTQTKPKSDAMPQEGSA